MTAYPFALMKTIQAIGVLYRTDAVRRMPYLRLLKLLYIANREAMRTTCRPIVGGEVYALPNGPVLQEVYDLIKGVHGHIDHWSKYFRTKGYSLTQVAEPNVGHLSQFEIETLQAVAKKHANDSEWDLVKLTHTFQEWTDPEGSSTLISDKTILEATGHADEADALLNYEAETSRAKQLLHGRWGRQRVPEIV
jgi:uncharacterized phage-associated protein